MRGIDFSVSHSDSAYYTIRTLERNFGFRSTTSIPENVWLIRADFNGRSISFNHKFHGHFDNVIVDGHDGRGDKRIIERAMRSYGRRGFDHRLRDKPIFGHRHNSRHDGHIIDSIDFARQRHFDTMVGKPLTGTSILRRFWKKEKEQKFNQMKIVKTKVLEINGKEREVTLVALTEGKKIKAGYSIKLPIDKSNEELAEKIALGRAKSTKTNLLDMELGKGLDKKFIMYAIVDDLFKQIERGIIKIKGVK